MRKIYSFFATSSTQVCLYLPVPLLCGTLIMLSQIVKHLADSVENFTLPDGQYQENEPITQNIASNLDRFNDDNEEHVFDVKSEVRTNIFLSDL